MPRHKKEGRRGVDQGLLHSDPAASAHYGALASTGLPVAQSVASAMPSAPPMSTLRDEYSRAASMQVESHGNPPESSSNAQGYAFANSDAQLAQASFYTPQELHTLQAQPVPQDVFQKNHNGPVQAIPVQAIPVAQAVPVAQAEPVFTTNVGVPIYAQDVCSSAAVTEQDDKQGVKSADKCLSSVPDIMAFLNTYNARPRLACEVHGYHQERRHRTVRYTDEEGNERERTEEYWETVTDFEYRLDLTQFIFPYGYIQSVTPGMSVPDLIQSYLDDTNMLKTLKMKKEIQFDFVALKAMVKGYIRQIGWHRGLDVRFPKANYTTRIWSHNALSAMWEDCCCKLLCHITIIPCIVMRCYRDCGGHKESGVRSVFQIQYHPLQVFEMIRPQLWCTGWSGSSMAMELIRNIFW